MKRENKFGTNKLYSPTHVPVVPFPVYPSLHMHVKLPAGAFKQVANVSSQLWVFVAHSSISKQERKSSKHEKKSCRLKFYLPENGKCSGE